MQRHSRGSTSPSLTHGEVTPLLIRLTIPMVFGILSMVFYNLVDTLFVGQLGKEQLAALSFTFPVVLVIGSLSLGIGMGASAAVSRAIGEGDQHRVRRLATDSLLLALIIVGVAAAAGMLTIDPLFRALGAGEATLPYIHEYMSIWYPGMIFVVVPMVGNNCIRATGDTRTPGIVMIIGAALNAILDPLLIFGLGPFPALGIAGAATATLIGRSITFIVALYVLGARERLIDLRPQRLAEVLASWKSVLYVGIPTAATRMIVPIGAGILTRIISGYGPEAVAGYGVATRLEFFALAIVNALASVTGPFIGQNLGAGRMDRVREGYRTAERICIAVGGFFLLVFLFFAPAIASAFSDAPEVVRVTTLAVRIISISYALQGIYLITVPSLNVLRRPLLAAGLGVLEMFVLVVPIALVGSAIAGLPGIFAGVAVGYSITGLMSRKVFVHASRKIAPPA
ncbi:MAG: MATE family efflux transporter [Spirochaetota bacterium]